MVYRNVERLMRSQAKIEVVRGVPEATTSRILYGRMTRTIDRPPTDEPEATGTWFGRDEGGFAQGVTRVSYTYTERMTFEDMAWWLQLILRNGVTGVSDGGTTTPGYLWAFTPHATDDLLATATVEAGDPDNVSKSSMLAVMSANFRFDQGASPYWQMDLNFMARQDVASAFTAALADRTRESIRSAGTKVFIDTTGAIGTTQLLATLRSGNIGINNNLEEKVFSEDETAISSDFARGEQVVTADLVLEQKNRSYLDKYLVGETQKVRIQKDGSVIHTAPTAASKRWEVDIPVAKMQSFADGMAGQNKIQTLGMMGYRNAANPVPIICRVVNGLATLP